MPLFEGASGLHINGGKFTDVQGHQFIFNIPYIDLTSLNHATAQFANLDQHKEVCELLLDKIRDCFLEIDRQQSQTPLEKKEAEKLDRACKRVDNLVTMLTTKDLAWRLYHSEKITSDLKDAEDAITSITRELHLVNNLNINHFEVQIKTAREHDCNSFAMKLEQAAQGEQTILSALGVDGKLHGNGERISDIAAALTKRSADFPSTVPDPERRFVLAAVDILRRMAKRSLSNGLPFWYLNSMEVIYETDPKSLLGRGGSGSVYRGNWNNLAVAVKVMNADISHITEERDLKTFLREVHTWALLRHRYILQFYGACFTSPKPFIVSALCKYGNARQFLRKFPETNRVTMLHQITLAMCYLHEKHVIHCDLKADNILVDDTESAVVADFGVASILNRWSSSSRVGHIVVQRGNGTLRWMAPERFDGQPAEKPSDVYSFAITAWELYSDGQIPFPGLTDDLVIHVVVDRQTRPARPSSLKRDDVWNIITASWQPDPKGRPTFSDLQIKLQELSGVAPINASRSLLTSSTSNDDTKATQFRPADQSSIHNLNRGGSGRHRQCSGAVPPSRQASIGLGFPPGVTGPFGKGAFNPFSMGNFGTIDARKLSSKEDEVVAEMTEAEATKMADDSKELFTIRNLEAAEVYFSNMGVPMSGMSIGGMPMSGMPTGGVPMSGMPMGVPMSGVPMGVPMSGVPMCGPMSGMPGVPIIVQHRSWSSSTSRSRSRSRRGRRRSRSHSRDHRTPQPQMPLGVTILPSQPLGIFPPGGVVMIPSRRSHSSSHSRRRRHNPPLIVQPAPGPTIYPTTQSAPQQPQILLPGAMPGMGMVQGIGMVSGMGVAPIMMAGGSRSRSRSRSPRRDSLFIIPPGQPSYHPSSRSPRRCSHSPRRQSRSQTRSPSPDRWPHYSTRSRSPRWPRSRSPSPLRPRSPTPPRSQYPLTMPYGATVIPGLPTYMGYYPTYQPPREGPPWTSYSPKDRHRRSPVYGTVVLPAQHHHKLVDKLVLTAVESKEADAKLVSDFFGLAVSKEWASPASFEEGFTATADH